jgi:hypothetical protein
MPAERAAREPGPGDVETHQKISWRSHSDLRHSGESRNPSPSAPWLEKQNSTFVMDPGFRRGDVDVYID